MIAERISFIDREKELAQIDALIKEWDTRRMLCIQADGGIGKTRLLQEVDNRYIIEKSTERAHLLVADIIDFDDRTFHLPENLGRGIAERLGNESFAPYLQRLLDHYKMKMADVSPERLKEEIQAVDKLFVDCFNQVSAQQRTVLLLDTVDTIEKADVLGYLFSMGVKLQNVLFLVAGRNVEYIWKRERSNWGEDIQFLELQPLEEKAGEEYLQKKQEALHVSLEPELEKKLLVLASGKPLLLDLAVGWLARDIPLDWLVESRLEELLSLSGEEKDRRRQEFERCLVQHISQVRTPMDRLILAMSNVYPLDAEMAVGLLGISEKEAEALIKEARGYAFVKSLPDGRITLHDEMRRMVGKYVWPEVDPDKSRKYHDSKFAAKHLEQRIQALKEQTEQFKKAEQKARERSDAKAGLEAFVEQEAAERELLGLEVQWLEHVLASDLDEGVKVFARLFDEATKAYGLYFRMNLLNKIVPYQESCSLAQSYEIESRWIKFFIENGEYEYARKSITKLLSREEISPERQVNILIERGNLEIRLGDVGKGISNFEKAIEVSEANRLLTWLIKAKNALGWAYRLIGERERAIECYLEAKNLCLEEGKMDDDYGWILNNLVFVTSYKDRKVAIDFGKLAIEHWRSTGNEIGLGAAYQVLGNVYYQAGYYDLALESFQEALDFFEPDYKEWMATIYSWRGAVYQDTGKMDMAENDLRKSLEIGPAHLKAMTLNRLGRVYMSRRDWDAAEKCLNESYECAQKIPDYLYWLGSLARLITIAAERGSFHLLDEFKLKLEQSLKKIEFPDGNSLGIAYFGLGRLALGAGKITEGLQFLKEGIANVAEYGPYAHVSVSTRLGYVEKDFPLLPLATVREVGRELKQWCIAKEKTNPAYGVVLPILYRWTKWEEEE